MKLIPANLTQKIGRQILLMKKESPRALFAVGIVGTITSTVLACRATLKLEEALAEMENDIKQVKARADLIPDEGYTSSNHNVDMAYTYAKGSMRIVKLYAPSIIIGGAAIGALTGSHITLARRNAALTAAYSALQVSFDAYRDRVREQLGEDQERNLYHAAFLEKMTDSDGKELEVMKVDPNRWSPYARFFDEYNPNWVKSAEQNKMFVQCQQNYLNHLLGARGHVFLNEAYDQLGIKRSKAGQMVGWVIGDQGDNFIDFGIFEAYNSQFVNGGERSIILDFNVDGVIYDKI